MNGVLTSLHNVILPLLRGEEHVCRCTCGSGVFSQQAYHVVAYHGDLRLVDPRQSAIGRNIVTRQEVDVIVGLLLGLCLSWFLLALATFSQSALRSWRRNHRSAFPSWFWTPDFWNKKDSFMRSHRKLSENLFCNVGEAPELR
ncbi:transmembrane protein 240-like isoform X2 [Embiotoca jacksoni]